MNESPPKPINILASPSFKHNECLKIQVHPSQSLNLLMVDKDYLVPYRLSSLYLKTYARGNTDQNGGQYPILGT